MSTYGFPSLPSTTPEGVFCWAVSSLSLLCSLELDILPDGNGNDICLSEPGHHCALPLLSWRAVDVCEEE